MIPNNTNYIRHINKPEWGLGKVTQVLSPKKFRAFFVNSGMTTLLYSPKYISIEKEIKSHPLLDNIDISKTNTPPTYKSMQKMVDIFLKIFPDGFNDDKYLNNERAAKLEARALLESSLNQKAFQKLLDEEKFQEITKFTLAVINKTTLIFPNEKMSLKNSLEDPANQEIFARSLFQLLYGEAEIELRFMQFAKVLTALEADKWTTQTYFLYLYDPERYLFLKPTVTKKAAAICDFQLHYDPKINWKTYKALLAFGEYFKADLRSYGENLTPRDMIDVQSFFWAAANSKTSKKELKSS